VKATAHNTADGRIFELLGPEDPAWQPLPFPTETAGVEPSALAAFLAFHNLYNTFTKLVLKDLSEGGTLPSQMECLRVLAINDELCQCDIAEAMGISRARVTGIVQALEKAGYVSRTRDDGDRRFARVHLTALGRAVDQEKALLREAHINGVFGCIPEEDRRELVMRLDDLNLRFQSRLRADQPPLSVEQGEERPPPEKSRFTATGTRSVEGGSEGQSVGTGALDQGGQQAW
jgi:DNA-binding MarR family transcriptional regulator